VNVSDNKKREKPTLGSVVLGFVILAALAVGVSLLWDCGGDEEGRPSREERLVCDEWDRILFKFWSTAEVEIGSDAGTVAEEQAFEDVGRRHGVDAQAVEDMVNKCAQWDFEHWDE
jgi:hypothetical protein